MTPSTSPPDTPHPTTSAIDLMSKNGLEGYTFQDGVTYPAIDDLASRLHFSPGDGQIWLDQRRMVLMHTQSLGVMRKELIETLGMDPARALLTRFGYESGSCDAQLAIKVRPNMSIFDAFSVGPQLHALEGVVSVEPVAFDVNVKRGEFYAEYIWRNSFEDEIHIEKIGVSRDPVCWTQIGYASGYSTSFMGRQILFREVECRGMGHQHCRIVGKPVEEWGTEADEDLRYLRAHDFVNRVGPRPAKAATPLPVDEDDDDNRWQMVGASAEFNIACHLLNRVADTEATVLFLGESGVGKEMFARTLHSIGLRSNKPFVAVNCAAIPDNLIEAELFGVEKGAFTGATTSKPGRFERAQGGTLFLDEIGTLSLSAQGKLLRALQEGEIERVGDTHTRKVDVRVVAATNVNLLQAVKKSDFREDLYYRLNVFPVHIPPLRKRRADIPLLLNRFLKRFAKKHRRNVSGFTERAIEALLNYNWPGNIRELENMIERGVILSQKDEAIDIIHLFTSSEELSKPILSINTSGSLDKADICTSGTVPGTGTKQADQNDVIANILDGGYSFDDLEATLLKAAVDRAGGNLSQAARLLGITRPQLAYRLNKVDGKS